MTHPISEGRLKFEQLLREGLTPKKAQEWTGITDRQRYNYMARIKRTGEPRALAAVQRMRRQTGVYVGSVEALLRDAEYDFGAWLVSQTAPGQTIADTLLRFARDRMTISNNGDSNGAHG